MIALDTSAIAAIAFGEPEADAFNRQIAIRGAVVGAPTLVEARLVLSSRMSGADRFMRMFLAPPELAPVDFSVEMYRVAGDAFERYGKGRGHPARLNFGDCLSYAVAKASGLPLLFKGGDFSLTDIRPAFP
jgi:ribonuclease VapC